MSGMYTPGPWSYRPEPHDDWGVVRAGRFWICQAKDPNVYTDEQLAAHRAAKTDPWEANARLIAAAPQLLEALQGIMAKLDTGRDAPGHHHTFAGVWDADNEPDIAGKPCEWCAHWASARAAIAAATGGAA